MCPIDTTCYVESTLCPAYIAPVIDDAGKTPLSNLIDAICECFTTNAEAALLTLGAEVSRQFHADNNLLLFHTLLFV